jgi:hypothetical protein
LKSLFSGGKRSDHLLVAARAGVVEDELVDDGGRRDAEDHHEPERQDQRHARLLAEPGKEERM